MARSIGPITAARHYIAEGREDMALRVLKGGKGRTKPMGSVAAERILAAFVKAGVDRTPMVDPYSFDPLAEPLLEGLTKALRSKWPTVYWPRQREIGCVDSETRGRLFLTKRGDTWWLERTTPGDDYEI